MEEMSLTPILPVGPVSPSTNQTTQTVSDTWSKLSDGTNSGKQEQEASDASTLPGPPNSRFFSSSHTRGTQTSQSLQEALSPFMPAQTEPGSSQTLRPWRIQQPPTTGYRRRRAASHLKPTTPQLRHTRPSWTEWHHSRRFTVRRNGTAKCERCRYRCGLLPAYECPAHHFICATCFGRLGNVCATCGGSGARRRREREAEGERERKRERRRVMVEEQGEERKGRVRMGVGVDVGAGRHRGWESSLSIVSTSLFDSSAAGVEDPSGSSAIGFGLGPSNWWMSGLDASIDIAGMLHGLEEEQTDYLRTAGSQSWRSTVRHMLSGDYVPLAGASVYSDNSSGPFMGVLAGLPDYSGAIIQTEQEQLQQELQSNSLFIDPPLFTTPNPDPEYSTYSYAQPSRPSSSLPHFSQRHNITLTPVPRTAALSGHAPYYDGLSS